MKLALNLLIVGGVGLLVSLILLWRAKTAEGPHILDQTIGRSGDVSPDVAEYHRETGQRYRGVSRFFLWSAACVLMVALAALVASWL
jgi:hypothetical protein